MKPLLISGIQPTNKLTLGNYLGSIKQIINQQDNYRCYTFVADWHSVTIPLAQQNSNYKNIKEQSWEIIKMYLACGIDIEKTVIFIQSEIKEHMELFYFLLTHSVVGELKRMTQYKHLSKQFTLSNGTEMALTGLLIYPVLMAADILIYDSDYVSIGEDQTQHLELTANLAQRINDKYKKEIFKIPKALNPQGNKSGIKIKDLQDPEIKMSKSSKSYEGVIFLNDSPEDIKRKIMKAKTDSLGKITLDKENQPGIVNLLEIYASMTNRNINEVFEDFKDKNYKELKETVADVVIKELSEIQERFKKIDDNKIFKTIEKNNNKCREIAYKKLEFIRNAI